MKWIRITLIALLLPVMAIAQVAVKEGEAKMGKKRMWTFSATYRYDKGITKTVMQRNIENAGLRKGKTKKGVTSYKGVTWAAISPTQGDYYYRMKSKKGKTTVFMTASRGYDNYIKTSSDSATAVRVSGYLQALDGQIAQELAIMQKEQEMKDLAKKNEALNKQLNDGKTQEAKKAQELNKLKKAQTAPLPVE